MMACRPHRRHAPENTINMHPDHMNVLVRSHHDYLRSLQHDSLVDEVLNAVRLLRRATGTTMVRTGEWLAGYTPQAVTAKPKVIVQKP